MNWAAGSSPPVSALLLVFGGVATDSMVVMANRPELRQHEVVTSDLNLAFQSGPGLVDARLCFTDSVTRNVTLSFKSVTP